MIKKPSVSGTEIIPVVYITIFHPAVPQAAVIADEVPLAAPAVRVPGCLELPETLPGFGDEFTCRRFQDIAQLPFPTHEKITGIRVAVVLDHHVTAALLLEYARRGLHSKGDFAEIVKKPDRGFGLAAVPPAVKQAAEKIPVRFRGRSEGRHLPAAVGTAGAFGSVQCGNELQVLQS